MQKINFISTFFFEILQRNWKLDIFGTLAMLGHSHQNHSLNLYQVFIVICMQKINLITHFFVKILQRNSKLAILGNLHMAGLRNLK